MVLPKLLVNAVVVIMISHLFGLLPWVNLKDESVSGVMFCWFVQGLFGLDSFLIYSREIITTGHQRIRNILELLLLLVSVSCPFLLSTYLISRGGNSPFVSLVLFMPPVCWLGHEFLTPWIGVFRAYGQVLWLIAQFVWMTLSSFFPFSSENAESDLIIEIDFELVMMQLGATALALTAVFLNYGDNPVSELWKIALFSFAIGIPDQFVRKDD